MGTGKLEHTPANFRATREGMGITLGEISSALNLSKRTVIRWEDPTEHYRPSEIAWQWLEDKATQFDWMVSDVMRLSREIGGEILQVPWYSEPWQGMSAEYLNRASFIAARELAKSHVIAFVPANELLDL